EIAFDRHVLELVELRSPVLKRTWLLVGVRGGEQLQYCVTISCSREISGGPAGDQLPSSERMGFHLAELAQPDHPQTVHAASSLIFFRRFALPGVASSPAVIFS